MSRNKKKRPRALALSRSGASLSVALVQFLDAISDQYEVEPIECLDISERPTETLEDGERVT
jgi:hypothetical protein